MLCSCSKVGSLRTSHSVSFEIESKLIVSFRSVGLFLFFCFLVFLLFSFFVSLFFSFVFLLRVFAPFRWTRLQPTTILIFLTLEQLKRLVDYTRGDL